MNRQNFEKKQKYHSSDTPTMCAQNGKEERLRYTQPWANKKKESDAKRSCRNGKELVSTYNYMPETRRNFEQKVIHKKSCS
ncbi:hypothetical protein CDL12_10416 [Handroanthus impetiginosus]|uniref:Uncharacterized protein n=1 Tax=Handroanthus impetiginosus TaxID=429701 RepID=A0A2G9HHB2_9LAMI|nr:hypothetical protein CDL12_10416 [Handroanthus impetiginosus]